MDCKGRVNLMAKWVVWYLPFDFIDMRHSGYIGKSLFLTLHLLQSQNIICVNVCTIISLGWTIIIESIYIFKTRLRENVFALCFLTLTILNLKSFGMSLTWFSVGFLGSVATSKKKTRPDVMDGHTRRFRFRDGSSWQLEGTTRQQ